MLIVCASPMMAKTSNPPILNFFFHVQQTDLTSTDFFCVSLCCVLSHAGVQILTIIQYLALVCP